MGCLGWAPTLFSVPVAGGTPTWHFLISRGSDERMLRWDAQGEKSIMDHQLYFRFFRYKTDERTPLLFSPSVFSLPNGPSRGETPAEQVPFPFPSRHEFSFRPRPTNDEGGKTPVSSLAPPSSALLSARVAPFPVPLRRSMMAEGTPRCEKTWGRERFFHISSFLRSTVPVRDR